MLGDIQLVNQNYPAVSKGTMGYVFNSFLEAHCPPFPPLSPLLLFILIKIMHKYCPKRSILLHVFLMKKQ